MLHKLKQQLSAFWRRHTLWRLSLSIAVMMWCAVAVALFSSYQLSIQPLVDARRQLMVQHIQQIQNIADTNPSRDLKDLIETLRDPEGTITVLHGPQGKVIGPLNRFPGSLPACPELKPFPVMYSSDDDLTLLDGCVFSTARYQVLVATDNDHLRQIQTNYFNATIAVLIGTFFIALLPSWIIRNRIKKQLEGIHSVVSQIEQGQFDGRIQLVGAGDEWDRIAHYINAMLDKIESSIEQIKGASDAIAHDLRTPLTRVKNRLFLIEQGLVSGSEASTHFQQVQNEFDDILHTFNAMLELGKLNALSDTSQFKSLDLATVVSDAAELAEPQFEDKLQTLDLSLQPCPISGEPSLLFRLVYNLLDNTYKYCPEGASVRVSLLNHRLIIQDDGPGVPPELHDKLFQRLYRADDSRSTQGHGLGLSLVEVVARLHSAPISLSYTRPADCRGFTISIDFSSRACD